MLEAIFERARHDSRVAFIPYVMAGDPNVETTARILHTLAEARADAIELGIPYGDPLADGPTIAAAGARALAAGTGIGSVFALIRGFRSAHDVPIVLFSYFNPVYQYGLERFARDAAAAGASGAIVPDIALEEGEELSQTLARHGLDMPLLVAPSTPIERAERIARQATGFVYVVSRLGVTGANERPDFSRLREQISAIRQVSSKPLAVGFGVGNSDHVRSVASFADGIIVGSALIDAYAGKAPDDAARSVATFVAPLIEATRR
jgi:tryptophan synthase alpha chain